MLFTLERITQPSAEPLTLAEIIEHVREYSSISQSAQDKLTSLVTGAREWVEDYTGRALVDQSWRLSLLGRFGAFAGGDNVRGTLDGRLPVGYGYYTGMWRWGRYGELQLRKAPIIAVTKFVSVDLAGVETDIDPTTYELRDKDSKWPRLVALNAATWSTWLSGELRVEYRAGFAPGIGSPDPEPDLSLIPQRFKQAILLHAEAHYDRDPKMMQLLLDAATNLVRLERSELSMA